VSPEKAESDYGVVVDADGKVNAGATDRLRADKRTERGEPEPFNFGYFPQAAE
jgi:N-methylhydantoinase B